MGTLLVPIFIGKKNFLITSHLLKLHLMYLNHFHIAQFSMLYPNLKESMRDIRAIDSIVGSYRAQFLKLVPVTQKLLLRNSVKKRPTTWRLTVHMQFHLLFLMSRFLSGKKVSLGISQISTSQIYRSRSIKIASELPWFQLKNIRCSLYSS